MMNYQGNLSLPLSFSLSFFSFYMISVRPPLQDITEYSLAFQSPLDFIQVDSIYIVACNKLYQSHWSSDASYASWH